MIPAPTLDPALRAEPADAGACRGGDDAAPFVTGFEASGLERRFTVVVPARFVAAERDRRLAALPGGGVGDSGQPPGQSAADAAAASALRRRIAAAIAGGIVQEALDAAIRREIAQRGLRPAVPPRAELPPPGRHSAGALLDTGLPGGGSGGGGADLRVRVAFEVLPEVPLPDLSAIALTRLRAEPGEAQIAAALQALARRHGALRDAPEGHRAGPGDVVVCDYTARIETYPSGLIAGPAGQGPLMPGRSGQHPPGWFSRAPTGVAITVAGCGFESGIPCADIRFTGSFPANTHARVFFAPRGAIPAPPEMALRLEVNVGLAGGTLPPGAVARLVIDELRPDTSYLAHGLTAVPLPTDGPIAAQRPSLRHVTKGGAALHSVLPRFEIGFPEGAKAVDVTLRLGWPALWPEPAAEAEPAAPAFIPLPDGHQADAEIAITAEGGPVPGFAEQLLGLRQGEARAFVLLLPATGVEAEFAGRRVEFRTVVTAIRRPVVDDALARTLGLPDLAALRERVRAGLQRRYDALSRARLRTELLDRLAATQADIPLPEALVRSEAERLWHAAQSAGRSAAPPGEGRRGQEEAALRAGCRAEAERRIRLGLLLSEIGRAAGIEVTDEELARAIRREAARHPGREEQVAEHFRANPQAAGILRAPILEEKAVEVALRLARVTERRLPTLREFPGINSMGIPRGDAEFHAESFPRGPTYPGEGGKGASRQSAHASRSGPVKLRFVLCHPCGSVEGEERQVFLADSLIKEGHDAAVYAISNRNRRETARHDIFDCPIEYFLPDDPSQSPHRMSSAQLISRLQEDDPDIIIVKGIDYLLANMLFSMFPQGKMAVIIGGTSKHELLNRCKLIYFESEKQVECYKGPAAAFTLPKYIKWEELDQSPDTEKDIDIVNIGNFDESRKAQELLLPFTHKYRVACLGGGSRLEHFRAICAENPRAIFPGYLKRKVLFGFLARSRVMVHTATWDGYPRAVAESLAAGVPVVGLAGVLDDVANGSFLTCVPLDQLYPRVFELLSNPEELEQAGRDARSHMRAEASYEALKARFYRGVRVIHS